MRSSRWGLVTSVLLATSLVPTAYAHRDDYLNETFVFQTLEAHEFEPELWLDLNGSTGLETSSRAYAAAFEYGITDRWMVDGFLGWLDPSSGPTTLHRFRAETRYRFGGEGDRLVDIAVSFEAEAERGSEPGEAQGEKTDQSYILTPRLVLSRDLGDFNLTLNLDLGREIRAGSTDRWTPAYAFGARYPRQAFVRYGVEFRQEFGDTRTSIILPQVWFALAREATFKIGAGHESGSPERRNFVRLVLEKEF